MRQTFNKTDSFYSILMCAFWSLCFCFSFQRTGTAENWELQELATGLSVRKYASLHMVRSDFLPPETDKTENMNIGLKVEPGLLLHFALDLGGHLSSIL